MLKALLWKEWHEQRWRVALATVWLLGMTAIGLRTRILSDAMILGMIGLPTAVILPAFMGMGLFASERKDGTLAHLMAQPVSRRQILIAKVIVGLLTYVTPIVICGVAVYLAVGGRELPASYLAGGTAAMIAFGVILFAWQLLAGLRCRREETYVLASAIVLGGWIMHGLVVDEWNGTQYLGRWIWAMNPFAVVELMDAWEYRQASEIWIIAAVQGLILAGLGLGLWLRFRRLRESRS